MRHGDAMPLVERLLEREEAHHVVDRARDLLHAPRGPGPDLRAHVVADGNAQPPRAACEPEVEPGVVDGDEHVGRIALEAFDRLAQGASEERELLEHREETHRRVCDEVERTLRARGVEERSAERLAAHLGVQLLQGVHELRAVAIAGRFSCDDEDARSHHLLERGASEGPPATDHQLGAFGVFGVFGGPVLPWRSATSGAHMNQVRWSRANAL